MSHGLETYAYAIRHFFAFLEASENAAPLSTAANIALAPAGIRPQGPCPRGEGLGRPIPWFFNSLGMLGMRSSGGNVRISWGPA